MYRDKAFDRYRADIMAVYERNDYKRLHVSSVYDYLEERYGELPGTEKTRFGVFLVMQFEKWSHLNETAGSSQTPP
jgi:hypothetical protein